MSTKAFNDIQAGKVRFRSMSFSEDSEYCYIDEYGNPIVAVREQHRQLDLAPSPMRVTREQAQLRGLLSGFPHVYDDVEDLFQIILKKSPGSFFLEYPVHQDGVVFNYFKHCQKSNTQLVMEKGSVTSRQGRFRTVTDGHKKPLGLIYHLKNPPEGTKRNGFKRAPLIQCQRTPTYQSRRGSWSCGDSKFYELKTTVITEDKHWIIAWKTASQSTVYEFNKKKFSKRIEISLHHPRDRKKRRLRRKI